MKKLETVISAIVCDICDDETIEFQDFVEVRNKEEEIDLCKPCFDKFVKSNLSVRTKSVDDKMVDLNALLGIKDVRN